MKKYQSFWIIVISLLLLFIFSNLVYAISDEDYTLNSAYYSYETYNPELSCSDVSDKYWSCVSFCGGYFNYGSYLLYYVLLFFCCRFFRYCVSSLL